VSLVKTPRDARGRVFYTDKDQLLSRGDSGKDVYLTIDLHLQSLVETALDNFKKQYSADSAMAIVVDPLTNEILVWSQNPRSTKNGAAVRNIAATDPIEPGSVVKPLLVSWGLERNFVHEKTVFDIPASGVKILDKTFKDENQRKPKKLTPEGILKYSSNVGAIQIQQRMGFKDFWTLIEKVGFLEKTGLQLSSESKGIMKKPREVQKVEQATMAFGQGFAITPLQLTRAYTVLAGDGYLRPLKFLKDDAKLVPEEHYEKVLSAKTLARIRKLMESALTDGGTAVNARVEGYNVAGKTGTSQKTLGKKGYSTESYWTSFVGFLPSDDPKYLIYAAFDNPRGVAVQEGGKTAAHLFAEVARLCIRSDDPLAPARSTTEDTVVRDLAMAPAAETNVDLNQQEAALIIADEAKPDNLDTTKIPNMLGLHLREAIKVADKNDFQLKLRGRGHFVEHQYPEGGTQYHKTRQVVLFLK
jgi:cell division protein FtsI (penicillin-binding protein 3)